MSRENKKSDIPSTAFKKNSRTTAIPGNIQAVFFDIDKTFYSHTLDRIPNGYEEMVESLRAKGIRCALCTARAKSLIENLLGDLGGKWDGIVAGNGSFVYDENLRPVFEKPLPAETVRKACTVARNHQAGLFVSGSDVFILDSLPSTMAKLNTIHARSLPVRQLRDDDRISVMSLCHEHPQILQKELEAIGGLFIHYTPWSMDISRDDLSKFEGIRVLMEHWNLDSHAYAAFGDSLNDLDMLENAAAGYAMAESEPVLLERFKTMPPAEEGGIAAWMKEEGWI